jgi:hypothetical protein
MRRPARVIALVLTGVALAAAPAAGARPRTAVTVFHAFTASGNPAIAVHRAAGSCFTAAVTSVRSDAWRCLVGNDLYDPCFSSAAAPGVVICPNANPATGTEIRLTSPLPTAEAGHGSPSPRSRPWTLELFDGAHCSRVSGATSVVHGVPLDYFCAGNTRSGLWGDPRRRTEPWTILSGPVAATVLSRRVSVEHVWT